jgi:hypothetical protein
MPIYFKNSACHLISVIAPLSSGSHYSLCFAYLPGLTEDSSLSLGIDGASLIYNIALNL